MKVLHVVDSAGFYGAEVVILNLMEVQRQMGVQHTLLSIGDIGVGPKDIEVEAEKRRLNVVSLRFRNGLNISGAKRILDVSKNLKSEIIHSHGYKGNILLGIIPKRLRNNIPVVTTLHGWTSKKLLSKIWIYECLDALALKNMDRVFAVSSAASRYTRLRILGVHPVVIANGLPRLGFENNAFPQVCPEVAIKCSGRFKIMSIGRLSQEKGFDLLIRAVAILVSRNVDACLVLVGEGDEKLSLARLADKENIMDRVHFIGYRDKAFNLIPYFDVFTLPSYREGLPITLLESMQAGIPIVSTNVGEVPEVLDRGRYGRLVQPGNADELANALEEIFRNGHEAKEIAVAAKQRALTEYSLEKMADQYLKLYEDLISKRIKRAELE